MDKRICTIVDITLLRTKIYDYSEKIVKIRIQEALKISPKSTAKIQSH